MCFSKKLRTARPFKLLLMALLLSSQSACLRGASKNPDPAGLDGSDSGDFRALELSGQSIATSQNKNWQIPSEKTFAYRICLVSRTTNAILASGQKFHLKKFDGSGAELKTDNLGCLSWKETLPFNFSSDSFYIEKERTLEGMGTYKGSVKLRYAVNPWLEYRGETGKEVVDLNRMEANFPEDRLIKEVAESGALAGIFSERSSRNLLLEMAPSVEIIHTGDTPHGKIFDIVLQLKPFIEPLDMNGNRQKYSFAKGRFKVFAQLVGNHIGETTNEKTLILAPELAPQEIDIRSESTIVFKQKKVPLNREISTGNVQVAIRVIPVNPPFPMNSFQGLYNAGPFNTIFKSSSLTQVKSSQTPEGFDYGAHLKSTANFDEMKKAGWAYDLPPVNYSNLEPRFVQVKEGETSTERTILYRVATQVTDGVTGSPISKQPFIIVHPKESCQEEDTRKVAKKMNPDGTCEEEIPSDHRGYLYWRDALTHQYYQRERRILQKFKIIQKRSNRSETYTLALNPWDEGWTFGGDLRSRIVEKDYKFEAGEQKPNLLMVDAFRYQTIRFRYVIDEFMTLNVKKAVVMALDPLVQRDTLYRGRIFEPLRDGVYLAKIALVKYYIDPFKNGVQLVRCKKGTKNCDKETDTYNVMKVSEGGDARKGQYTTIIKKLLRVQAGRITTPIEFSMRDLRMMSIRSNIMVQIEPIDERRLLRDNLVEQKIAALEKEYFDLNPSQMNEKDKENFQKRYGYLPENLTPEQRERIIAERSQQYKKQRDFLIGFIEKSKKQLETDRSKSIELQKKRFELVDRIERDLDRGSAEEEYSKTNPLISLPRVEAKEILTRARERLSSMEWDMKKHWSSWNDSWLETQKAIKSGQYLIPNKISRRSYSDYMNLMQTFLMDHGLPAQMDERDLERLKINNYTQNPVAPLMDLNLYRNPSSGLKMRTFIGPCTLVENDNMSEMRPTDTVDEQFCEHIDCKEVLYTPRTPLPDNSQFENSAHHDSLKPFAQLHVDDIIPIHRNNEQDYERKMDATSQIGDFTKAFNLTFVSLEDQPLTRYKQGCSFDGKESCFSETSDAVLPSTNFISALNERPTLELLSRYFSLNTMEDLLNTNEEVLRTDSLQPLWERAKEDAGLIRSFLKSNKEQVPFDYAPSLGRDDALDYLSENAGAKKKVEKENVSQWLAGGLREMRLDEALRICNVLSKQASDQLQAKKLVRKAFYGRKDHLSPAHAYLLYKCMSQVRYLPKSKMVYFDGIHFDRKYKILKTGSYEHIAGVNMNLNVGIDFGVGSYQDVSTSTSAGINDAAILGLPAAGIGVGMAVAGIATAPLMLAGGAAIAATGGLIIADRAAHRSDGASITQGQSVNAATFLVVQKAKFEIEIKSHEKCATLKLGRDFVAGLSKRGLGLKAKVSMKNKAVQSALMSGFMVCNGFSTNQPEKVNESYYYVTQHFTAGDMLDDVNLLNHIWLLALRGQNDFNEFIRILRSQKVDKDGKVVADSDAHDYPLSRLGKVYKQVIPTFPGLYSVQED